MAGITSILGAVGGKTLATPIEAIFSGIDKIFTSDEELEEIGIKREQLNLMKAKLMQNATLMQGEINKIEAQHRSVFVAGWRPFIGWVCGSALAYQFVLRDLLMFAVNVHANYAGGPLFDPALLPELQMGHLITILGGMLGLGAMRTSEKLKGRTK